MSTLAPFALAIYVDLIQRPLSGMGLFAKPPELFGLPGGLVLQWLLIGWAGIGAWVVWTTHSRLKSAVALVLCTTVSLFGIVLLPALVLIWQNLGA